MFFPKLRRQAKWVFLLLAIIFAVGFVVFGVGSGGGLGFLDIFNNNSSSSSSPSETKARNRIKQNPQDAAAYQDLSSALQTKGDLRGAAGAVCAFDGKELAGEPGIAQFGQPAAKGLLFDQWHGRRR